MVACQALINNTMTSLVYLDLPGICVLSLWIKLISTGAGQNVEYKLTGPVTCQAKPKSWHPCLLLQGEKYLQVHTCPYIIYWTTASSSILVFIASLLSAYFRLDLLLTWLNEKKYILTCFSIAVDIFSLIISCFIPSRSIVRMGLCSKKPLSILKRYLPGLGSLSCSPSQGVRKKLCYNAWGSLQVTCVALKIPAELIWKVFWGGNFSEENRDAYFILLNKVYLWFQADSLHQQ